MQNNPAIAALRHHVSGAIARGEKEAVIEIQTRNTIPQGTLLFPRAPFAFRTDTSRLIRVACGQSFWVMNTQANQSQTGNAQIARSNSRAGHWFPLAQVAELFAANI